MNDESGNLCLSSNNGLEQIEPAMVRNETTFNLMRRMAKTASSGVREFYTLLCSSNFSHFNMVVHGITFSYTDLKTYILCMITPNKFG